MRVTHRDRLTAFAVGLLIAAVLAVLAYCVIRILERNSELSLRVAAGEIRAGQPLEVSASPAAREFADDPDALYLQRRRHDAWSNRFYLGISPRPRTQGGYFRLGKGDLPVLDTLLPYSDDARIFVRIPPVRPGPYRLVYPLSEGSERDQVMAAISVVR